MTWGQAHPLLLIRPLGSRGRRPISLARQFREGRGYFNYCLMSYALLTLLGYVLEKEGRMRTEYPPIASKSPMAYPTLSIHPNTLSKDLVN